MYTYMIMQGNRVWSSKLYSYNDDNGDRFVIDRGSRLVEV